MSRVMALLQGVALSLLLPGCGSDTGSGSTGIDYAKLVPACFEQHVSSPLISSGDFTSTLGLTTSTTWNDPHVIQVGSTYYMYASSDDNFNHDIRIYRLKSTDGINWSPDPTSAVLQKSGSGFDTQSTETPAVVYFKNKYHMFWTGYTDYSDTTTFRVGHATSTDGISWSKDGSALLAPTDPAGAPNLDFNQYLVAEPAPVVFNNKLYLYFTAVGANLGVGTTLQVIGVTSSSDGVTWSTPQSALEPDQSIYKRGSPDYFKGYSTPNAIVLDGKLHLFFDVARTDAGDSSYNQEKLHHAWSSDGLTNWTTDSSYIFDKSDFSWTADEIRSPSMLLIDSRLYMWFAGHQTLTLGIGLATCDLSA